MCIGPIFDDRLKEKFLKNVFATPAVSFWEQYLIPYYVQW